MPLAIDHRRFVGDGAGNEVRWYVGPLAHVYHE